MNFSGDHFLILGLGESGLAMARWLARQGKRLRVADSRTAPPNVAALKAAAPDAEVIAGPFAESLLDGIDTVALSPGVPAREAVVQAAIARGLAVVSEIELFARAVRALPQPSRLVAITGSNGKTTTTALTAHLLNAAGLPAVACGNISPSALDALMAALDAGTLPAAWVLELSSFQLEKTYSLAADAATVLNISEDHLDRYRDLDDYAESKRHIFDACGLALANRDDAYGKRWLAGLPAAISFGLDAPTRENDYGIIDGCLARGTEKLLPIHQLKLAGLHNAANALAALALCAAVGVEAARVLPALVAFRGLPHRVERVAEIGGVAYYDDSKGTNVGATLAALQGLGRKVAIILGGEGKDQDFAPLKAALTEHARAVALIGRDAGIIGAAIAGHGTPERRCASLEEAVRWCAGEARPGDAVLLSPACASFDMFRNYGHRAEVFIAAVRALAGGAA